MSSGPGGRLAGMAHVSAVDFVTVPVTDLAASRDFYAMVLGFESDYPWGAVGAEFQVGGTTVALLDMAAIGQPFAPNAGPLALRVEDVDAERARLEAEGVVFGAQFDSGVCHQAIFHDPDGNVIALHHRYAPR